MPPLPLTTVFDNLPDPRRETVNKLHRLTDILVLTTCAVIAGAESWEAIAEYGRTKEAFFRRSIPLERCSTWCSARIAAGSAKGMRARTSP